MKKKYPLSIAIVAFVILLFQWNNLSAQSGNSCSSAVAVTPSDSCNFSTFTTNDSVYYFSFTATSSCAQIVVVSSATRCAPGSHPHRLTLFGGTCSALQWLEDEFLPDIAGCQELAIDASNLTANNTYYIRVSRQIKDTGCVATPTPGAVCTPAAPLSFQLCIRSFDIFIPPDFGLELPAISHSYYTNKGQVVDVNGNPRFDIRNYTNNASPAIYCTDTAVSFVFAKIDTLASTPDTLHRVDLVLTGANIQPIQRVFKTEKTSGYLNYFLAHVPTGVTNVKGYSRTVWKEVYPNIDMQFYSNNVGTKFYFVRNPGGDPNDIVLQFNGATAVNVTPSGGLDIVTTLGKISFEAGHAYAINPGNQIVPMPWQAKFVQVNATTVKFDIHNFPSWMPLIIQVDRGHKLPVPAPPIGNLEHSTYYGGQTDDVFRDITTDTSGNVFATGSSTSSNFPILGAYQGFNAGSFDAVIVKFDTAMIQKYATYYGGSDEDDTRDIIIDNSGNIIITGTTLSPNLPLANPGGGAYIDSTLGGTRDAFIAKIIPNPLLLPNQQLVWSTYLGGSGSMEFGINLSLDKFGNLYLVGKGDANSPLVNKTGSYNNSTGEGYIAKFNIQDSLVWATLIAGTGGLFGLSPDTSGNIFVTGIGQAGFPVVNSGGGAYVDSTLGGAQDVAIVKFNSADTIIWATYFGGSSIERGDAIVVDKVNDVYVGGYTLSSDFPFFYFGSNTYIDSTIGAGYDIFIAKFSNGGVRKWATYYGGATYGEYVLDIAIDSSNNIYFIGITNSSDFPLFPLFGGYNQNSSFANNFWGDAFILAFNQNNELVWATAFGGANVDKGFSLTTFQNSKLYIVGSTASINNTFPLVDLGSGAWFQDSLNGNNLTSGLYDGFISRFSITSMVNAGINENIFSNGNVLVYPNPSSGNFTIQMNLNDKTDLTITVFSILGQSVFDKTLKNQRGQVNETINLSSLSDGMYMIRVATDKEILPAKVIKQQ